MKEKNIQVSLKEAYQNAVFLLEKGNFSIVEKQLAEILKKDLRFKTSLLSSTV